MKLTFALVATVSLAVPAYSQSLGDLATKTQEERDKPKATPTPTKRYTDRDLKDAPPAPTDKSASVSDAPASIPVDTKKTDSKASDKDKGPAKDEAYWRARWTPVEQKLAGETARSRTLNSRIADLTFELSGIGPLNARRGGVESERQRLITESHTLDAAIGADKAVFEAIQEEGR
jgi:hypothetical protein